MKVLITGITGFVGSHMADYLLAKGNIEVWGTMRWRSRMENIEHIKDKVKLIECELTDPFSVSSAIKKIRPDKIFHLAAQSFVPASWHAPMATLALNTNAELNIFEAVKDLGLKTWIQLAGSSEEYGMVYPNETPIKETNPLRPLSPYGVSKVTQDMLGYQYAMSYKMNIVRTRGFNHTGPRRGDVFVESNFAKQIALIEKKKQEPTIFVGNLDARRDYTDVRDMVRAYFLATEKCKPGEEYNICQGKDWSIREMLDMLLSYSNLKVNIKPDESRMRPSDVMILLGDHSKFTQATGWNPEIPFETTLRDLLNYWRERV
jgi:GDP-4-dehydro-6-deoxy-D-mannose reductase